MRFAKDVDVLGYDPDILGGFEKSREYLNALLSFTP